MEKTPLKREEKPSLEKQVEESQNEDTEKFELSEESEGLRKSRDDDMYNFFK